MNSKDVHVHIIGNFTQVPPLVLQEKLDATEQVRLDKKANIPQQKQELQEGLGTGECTNIIAQ